MGGYDDMYCYQPLNPELRVRFRHWADRRADYSMNVDGRRKVVRPLIPVSGRSENATVAGRPIPKPVERSADAGPARKIQGQ